MEIMATQMKDVLLQWKEPKVIFYSSIMFCIDKAESGHFGEAESITVTQVEWEIIDLLIIIILG